MSNSNINIIKGLRKNNSLEEEDNEMNQIKNVNDNINDNNTKNNCNDINHEKNINKNTNKENKKLKTKSNSNDSLYSFLVEILLSDKQDMEKIKALIFLEENFPSYSNKKSKLNALFRIFDEIFNQNELISSPLLKGQILLTGTTILILLKGINNTTIKVLFENFLNNILVENIKNVNNNNNLYLRQISCECLNELEIEYPGILFELMGKKTLEIFDNFSNNENNDNMNSQNYSESKSIKSLPTVNYQFNYKRNNNLLFGGDKSNLFNNKTITINKNEIPKFEYKKTELINDGLLALIENESYYVFQYYLSLYATILKNLIKYYSIQYKYLNESSSFSYKEEELKQNLSNEYLMIESNNNINNKNDENIITNAKQNFDDIDIFLEDQNFTNKTITDENESFTSSVLYADNKTNNNLVGNVINIIFDKLPYLKNFSKQSIKNHKIKLIKELRIPFSKINYQNLYINQYSTNKILYLNFSKNSKYMNLLKSLNNNDNNIVDINLSNKNIDNYFNQECSSYINKGISKIIQLLPKTTEIIKTTIWKKLSYIIEQIDINEKAILPLFNYYHLNCYSLILTFITIKLIEKFKNKVNSGFILKIVFKLCLLINDKRLKCNLRVLALRNLINLKNSKKIIFNYDKYLNIISYYLHPNPFDNLILCSEKIKTLFLFFSNDVKCQWYDYILQSTFVMDEFKYYPIFSCYTKSLFKSYFYLIVKYPYEKEIKNVSDIIKNNIKEVPKILPNVINLLHIIKNLNNCHKINKDQNNKVMNFDEIYQLLLIEMSNFLSSFNSHSKLNNYFELFLEIAKNNTISPNNIIKSLQNLYNSTKKLKNWKIEKNILEICRTILIYHDLEIIKKNNLEIILLDINKYSFDYGNREKAKLYYKLLTNVEKEILLTFLICDDEKINSKNLNNNNKEYNKLNSYQTKIDYNYINLGDQLKNNIILQQSNKERKEGNLFDRGTSIYNCGCEGNVLLLSQSNTNKKYENFSLLCETNLFNNNDESLDDDNKNIKNIIENEEEEEGNDKTYCCMNENKINFQKLNDYIDKIELDQVINSVIKPSDILRLFINNKDINDQVNTDKIIINKLFSFEKPKINDNNNKNEEEEKIEKNKFIELYFEKTFSTRFYIKLPLNIYLDKMENLNTNQYNKLFSLSLFFGSISSLDIISPILIPYIEYNKENSSNNNNNKFPYFYNVDLIIYPKLPIPNEIKSRVIFYDKDGKCCTSQLQNLKVVFEDFFLPINLPFTVTDNNKIKEYKKILFKYLWKKFKKDKDNCILTNRTFNLKQDIIIEIVKKRLISFLINDQFENNVYKNINQFYNKELEKNDMDDNNNNVIIKKTFNEKTSKFKNISYDFIMDNILENNFQDNNESNIGKYILAEVLIFIPEKYHLLFKIKISFITTIIEIRSDCLEIIEYLDDYFDSWTT